MSQRELKCHHAACKAGSSCRMREQVGNNNKSTNSFFLKNPEELPSLKKPKASVATPAFDANSDHTILYNKTEADYEEEEDIPIEFSFKKLYLYAGPGILMSIAYLDPGNIAGDLDAGIKGHYALLWTLLWAIIIGYLFQTMSSSLGVVTQRNLAQLSAEQFSKKTKMILWVMVELAIIDSDIQEVIGTATALLILFKFPLWLGTIVTILDSLVFLFIHYFGIRKLEAFFVAIIMIMMVCFFTNMFYAKPDVSQMLEGTLLPTLPQGAGTAFIGLIGSVIMPHNLYLHSALVLSRKINARSKNQVKEANYYFNLESAISLFITFIVNAAIIATFAVYAESKHDQTANMNLYNVSDVLSKEFGLQAKYIWAIGLLAAGQSSTMTGTYAGQFVMEGFLEIKLPVYQRVLLTRCVAIIPALSISFLNQNSLLIMQNYLNIVQSIMLPFAVAPLLKFVGSTEIMGSNAVPFWKIVIYSIISFVMFSMNFIMIYKQNALETTWLLLGPFTFLVLYASFVITLIREPIRPLRKLEQIEDENDEGKVDVRSQEVKRE